MFKSGLEPNEGNIYPANTKLVAQNLFLLALQLGFLPTEQETELSVSTLENLYKL